MTHFLREFNFWLGFLTLCGLLYRTPSAWKHVASRRLYLALCLFPIGVTAGSVYAFEHDFPPSPLAPFFTGAFIILAVVLVWWPKPLNGTS